MSCAQFDALRTRAAGHCEACGIPESEAGIGKLVIDHDHRYGLGAVRGLICSACNSALGGLEHTSPTAERHYVGRFAEYVCKAWFMEIVKVARVLEPNPDDPEQRDELMSMILRSRFVVPVTRATGQQPEVVIHTVLAPGPVRFRVRVAHVAADFSGLEVHTVLLVKDLGDNNVETESILVKQYDFFQYFDRVGVAVTYIRDYMKHAQAQRDKNVAHRKALAAQWAAEREARKTAASPSVEQVIRDRFKGGVRFSQRDVMEAAGCSLPSAGRTVNALLRSGVIVKDGLGPKTSGMGRAPMLYVLAE